MRVRNTSIEESNAAPNINSIKYPDVIRATFAKSKNERGEDAYRFIGIFKWCETRADGIRIYKRSCSELTL